MCQLVSQVYPPEEFLPPSSEQHDDTSLDIEMPSLEIPNAPPIRHEDALARAAEEEEEFFRQTTYFPFQVTRTPQGGVIVTPRPKDQE